MIDNHLPLTERIFIMKLSQNEIELKKVILEKFLNQQVANRPRYDWNLADIISSLEIEIETGNSFCRTCQNHGEVGSPCGRCGRGMRSI
jgi:hypothetical protein